MNKKNIISALLVIVVIVIAVVLYQSKQASKPDSFRQSQTDPNKAPFVAGTVTKVETNLVTFQVSTESGPQERVAVVSPSTQFTRQVMDKSGNIEIAPAAKTDLKTGVHVIVFSANTDAAPIEASKIQIY